ncbi:MAG TPA: hypothetical protein VHM28_03305, partial [Anaerolineales bacterium]|nr:hypothetical protein [Anaerolineales bacterium]
MKRPGLLFVIITAMLFAAACGSSPVQSAPVTDTPTEAQASSSTGSNGSATQVTVTLADNTITSTLATFQAGVPYTFVITNTGHHNHNFNINPPISVAGSLDAALSNALLSVTQDNLRPGQTFTVTYTFPDSAVGAQLEFSCLIQRHYDDGMR